MVQIGDGSIKGKVPLQKKSICLTFLGDHGKSMIHSFLGAAKIHQLIVKVYTACRSGADSEDSLQKLGTSGPYQSIKSEDFPFPHIKSNVLEMRLEFCR